MGKIILKESQLIELIEVAMDISRYREPIFVPKGGENNDVEESTQEIIGKLKELISMMKANKRFSSEDKTEIFKNLDSINKTYDKIKYKKRFT